MCVIRTDWRLVVLSFCRLANGSMLNSYLKSQQTGRIRPLFPAVNSVVFYHQSRLQAIDSLLANVHFCTFIGIVERLGTCDCRRQETVCLGYGFEYVFCIYKLTFIERFKFARSSDGQRSENHTLSMSKCLTKIRKLIKKIVLYKISFLIRIYWYHSDCWKHISQGSVATQLRCDGRPILSNHKFSKECDGENFWKSVSIWWRYGQNFAAYVFGATL